MTTAAEAAKVIAQEAGPEGAALFASIMEQQAADREAMMPTWEVVEQTRKDSYARGFSEGYRVARDELMDRLFGPGELGDFR